MQLDNAFLLNDKLLYEGVWSRWICHGNGNGCGGLELHHIFGRRKHVKCLASILNSALLCKKCHDTMGHSLDEHRMLFGITFKFLQAKGHEITPLDAEFLTMHSRELLGYKVKICQ